jgi:hypothetical protein
MNRKNKQLTPADLNKILFEHLYDKTLQFNLISFANGGSGGLDFNEYFNKDVEPQYQEHYAQFRKSYEALINRLNKFYEQ